MPNDRDHPAHERSAHDPDIDARVELLERVLLHYAQTGTLEHTLGHGLDAVSGQLCNVSEQLGRISQELKPLRRLGGGDPVELSDAEQACWDNLLAAQARPTFREVKALPMGQASLRFASDLPELPAPDRAMDPTCEDSPTWRSAS